MAAHTKPQRNRENDETYFVFDDKLGSDVFRRLFRLRLCDNRSLYDSDRFTDTGADFDFVLQKKTREFTFFISIINSAS